MARPLLMFAPSAAVVLAVSVNQSSAPPRRSCPRSDRWILARIKLALTLGDVGNEPHAVGSGKGGHGDRVKRCGTHEYRFDSHRSSPELSKVAAPGTFQASWQRVGQASRAAALSCP